MNHARQLILALVGLLLVSTLTARDAHAQPAAAQPVPGKKLARHYYALGQKLYAEKQYPRAISVLQAAYRMWPVGSIQYNIALCYFAMGQRLQTAQHLHRYLRGATPKQRASVPAALRRLLGEFGQLVIRAGDDMTAIWIDGQRVGTGKIDRLVAPGRRAVELRVGTRTVRAALLEVHPGKPTVWPAEVPRPRPAVRVPPRKRPRPRVVVKVVTPPIPTKTVRRKPRRLHWSIFVSLGAVAVGAAASAAGLSVRTRDLFRRFDADPTHATRNEGRRLQLAANAMWGVTAAAAVAAGLVAIWTRWRSPARERAAFELSVSPGGAAARLRF